MINENMKKAKSKHHLAKVIPVIKNNFKFATVLTRRRIFANAFAENCSYRKHSNEKVIGIGEN
jgi:hypothetical protein